MRNDLVEECERYRKAWEAVMDEMLSYGIVSTFDLRSRNSNAEMFIAPQLTLDKMVEAGVLRSIPAMNRGNTAWKPASEWVYEVVQPHVEAQATDWQLQYHIDPNEEGFIVGDTSTHYAPRGLDVVARTDGGVRHYRSFRPDSGDVIGEWTYD